MTSRSFSSRKPPLLSEAVELGWVRLMRSQRRIFESIERDLEAAGCPPLAWYDVMLELDRAEDGRLRPMEIEKRTLFAQPNLSRMIGRLEQEGLVRREAFSDDGRGHWVVITDKGRHERAAMWEVYGAAIQKHFGARLTNDQAEQLADLLGKLV